MEINKRVGRLERRLRALHPTYYPEQEDLSFIADIGGVRAYFPTDDLYVRNWFYPRYRNGLLHEPQVSKYLCDQLDSNSVFVDVGAHVGYFSVIAALRARAVFAIEPQEFLIGRIHRNVVANHLTNVTTMHAAVGDTTGFAPIPKVGGPGTKIGESNNLVPMIRLDDYFTDERSPTVIKIDTEGFEYQVLEGAKNILQTRPVLLVEVHAKMTEFGYNRQELWELLKSLGYSLRVGDHRKDVTEFVEVDADDIMKLSNQMLICEPV